MIIYSPLILPLFAKGRPPEVSPLLESVGSPCGAWRDGGRKIGAGGTNSAAGLRSKNFAAWRGGAARGAERAARVVAVARRCGLIMIGKLPSNLVGSAHITTVNL